MEEAAKEARQEERAAEKRMRIATAEAIISETMNDLLASTASDELRRREARDATIKDGLRAVCRWITRGGSSRRKPTGPPAGDKTTATTARRAASQKGKTRALCDLWVKLAHFEHLASRDGQERRAPDDRRGSSFYPGKPWRGTRGFVYWRGLRDAGRVNRERG